MNTFYEDQYNTRRNLDVNMESILQKWQTDSEAARSALTAHIDLRYGDAKRETLDIFPASEGGRWLVYIHGGYWRRMTKDYYSYVATPFVRAGWHVAVIEYDLCPAVTIHTITEQCRRGIAWVSQHAADYGVTCEEIVISGHSAGGHLTAMMFATDWQDYGIDPQIFSGGIAISGLFDLDPITQTAMNEDLKLSMEDVQALSPSRLLPQIDAPLVLAVGEKESSEFHRQISVLKGVPAWDAISTPAISISDCHHFNVIDDFMNLQGAMWSALGT